MSGNIEGLDRILAKINGIGDRVQEAVVKEMNKSVKTVQAEAKLLAPVDDGQLRNSITAKVEVNENGVEGVVETSLEYAPYVEFGTGEPGSRGETTGSPRAPEADEYSYTLGGWVYFDEKRQEFVYTKGRPATPFMYPAINNNKNRIRQNIADAASKAVRNNG